MTPAELRYQVHLLRRLMQGELRERDVSPRGRRQLRQALALSDAELEARYLAYLGKLRGEKAA